MATYEQVEVLRPDIDVRVDTNLPAPSQCGLPPHTVYNLNPNIHTCPDVSNNYHIYEPANRSNDRQYNLEEILRQNPEVWSAYVNGRYELQADLDNKKIILKERSGPCSSNSDFVVKRYRAQVRHSKNDHLLLVSFAEGCSNPAPQAQAPPQLNVNNHHNHCQ